MHNVTMRMRKDLRERILKAAEANGRSMATECEARLEQSFVFQDVTAWLEHWRAERRKVLDELTAITQEMGLYG